MSGAKKSTWIGGTAFLCLVLIVAAWFLVIAPKRASAADVRAQAAQIEAQNDTLELKVAKLAADAKRLPELEKQLAQLRIGIPSDAALAAYLRQLDKVAAAHDVTIENVAPSAAQAVTLAQAAAPAPTPAPTESAAASVDAASSTPSETASPAATQPTANPVPEGFAAIPLSLTVVGTYDDTTAFVSDLQKTDGRLYLVGGFTATGQPDQEASAGKPKTKVGDQELVISGFAYVLPDAAAAATPAPEPTAGPKLPKAPNDKDPYTPVKGEQ